jgi:hypothetical protein
MPSCFCLYRKGSNTKAHLQDVDRDLCQNLELPYSDDEWVAYWYDSIGLLLAIGRTFEQIIDALAKDEPYGPRWRIACYLNTHYTSDAWKEWK